MSEELQLHGLIPQSCANGPGLRTVIWFQGCDLGCPGCFNPETHSRSGGERWSVAALVDEVLALESSIEGVTISGGEPFQQLQPLRHFLRLLKSRSQLSVMIFSGYRLTELKAIPGADDVLAMTDLLIAGRYVNTRHLGRGLRGSSNQKIHFLSDRYCAQQLAEVPEAEILIDRQGRIIYTGVEPALPPGISD